MASRACYRHLRQRRDDCTEVGDGSRDVFCDLGIDRFSFVQSMELPEAEIHHEGDEGCDGHMEGDPARGDEEAEHGQGIGIGHQVRVYGPAVWSTPVHR